MAEERGRRIAQIGVVVGDKMPKTLKVELQRIVQDPHYGKSLKRATRCYVHDEKDEAKLGDRVEIMPSRPLSKLKRWRLVRIVEKAPQE